MGTMEEQISAPAIDFGNINATITHRPKSDKDEENIRTSSLADEPSYAKLFKDVSAVLKSSSWFEMYGVDNLIIWGALLVVAPFGFWLQTSAAWAPFLTGMVLIGIVHSIITTKGGHLSTHCALARSPLANKLMQRFFVEFCGGFTVVKSIESHVALHHPHTNIIGLGDSSSWKVPVLGRFSYMFIAPLFLPVITPLAAISQLWGRWKPLLVYLLVAGAGYATNLAILTYYCNLNILPAIVTMFASRAVMSIPFIHVNIFQHIGLNMYDRDARPRKLRLMSTGCLNLPRNTLLETCFGHALINCHVEHHLFERLSDNMCLKVKPVVRKYIQSNGLPYLEDTYMNRLSMFLERYKELMVDAPPITKYIGIQ